MQTLMCLKSINGIPIYNISAVLNNFIYHFDENLTPKVINCHIAVHFLKKSVNNEYPVLRGHV